MLKTIINGQCEDLGIDNLALEVMPDHIHLFVGAKPTHTPYKIVKQLKANPALVEKLKNKMANQGQLMPL